MSEGVRDRETEAQRIADWRERCLCEAGYDDDVAWLLAQHEYVDLHAAIRLLERGCDQTLALVILL